VRLPYLEPAQFFADYLATYLERDVRQLVNVRNLSVFEKFLRLLALRSGQVLQFSGLAADVGLSSTTIKSWVSVLEATNVVYLLRPFYNNFGKRLTKSPKLYFMDTGLLCFLCGIHSADVLKSNSLLGAFFETLCVGQLVRDRTNRGAPVELYSRQSRT